MQAIIYLNFINYFLINWSQFLLLNYLMDFKIHTLFKVFLRILINKLI